jgi:uncharacterized MAPEG superfamily protein
LNPSLLSVKILAFFCVVLFMKMLAIAAIQIATRSKTGEFTNPVDARFFAKREAVAGDPVMVLRGANAFRNDLENIPLFLFLATFYVLLGCWPQGCLIYFGLFTCFRIIHTDSYLKNVQPWRSFSFSAGALICLILCFHILYNILTA